jgi:hypothetical protein
MAGNATRVIASPYAKKLAANASISLQVSPFRLFDPLSSTTFSSSPSFFSFIPLLLFLLSPSLPPSSL